MDASTNQQYLMMLGLVSQLPQEKQDEIKRLTSEIESLANSSGECGALALAIAAVKFAGDVK